MRRAGLVICTLSLGCNVVLGLDERPPKDGGGGSAGMLIGPGGGGSGGSSAGGMGGAGGAALSGDPWLQVFSTVGDFPTRTRGVAVDAAQNVYVAGEFDGTVDLAGESVTSMGGDDAFMLKLRGDGQREWSHTVGGTQSQRYWDVVVSGDRVFGSLILTGTATLGGQQITPAGTDSAVEELTAGGAYVRHALLTSTQTWAVRNLAATSTGVTTVGVFRGQSMVSTPVTADALDAMIVDLDDNLSVTSTHLLNAPAADANIIDVVARDDERYAAGWIDTAGEESITVSARGGALWQQNFDGPSLDIVDEIAGDGSQLILAGSFYSTLDIGQVLTAAGPDGNGLLLAMGYDGSVAWHYQVASVAASSIKSVAYDASGNILLAGVAYGVVDLGGGPLTPEGTHNIFVARFDSSGQHLASAMLGGNGMQFVDAIAPAFDDGIIVGGRFFGELRVGDDTFTGSTTEGVGFVARVVLP